MANESDAFELDGIGAVSSVEEVQKRINARYDKLFIANDDGSFAHYVCGVCDENLLHSDDIDYLSLRTLSKNRSVLQWSAILDDDERIPAVEDEFKLNIADNEELEEYAWLNNLALSPRGIIGQKSNHKNSLLSLICCSTCQKDVAKNRTPLNAIVNKNFVGCAPECLTDLTELEMSLITPVKGYGYCFTFRGGPQKNLKGCLTFMRVEERKICRAITHLEAMGLTKHIVVLLSGRMTPRQHERARKNALIRTDKVIEAVKWLCANHRRWKNVDVDALRTELEGVGPVVIDRTSTANSENQNVEEEELFTCYYPDSAVNGTGGGFDDPGAFKKYVTQMKKDNFNVELQLDIGKEFVRQSDGDILLNSCLLQFPYGVCSMEERRVLKDGSYTTKSDLRAFLKHLSKLAQTCFQKPMIQLVMYSLLSKYRLLFRSRLQLKGKHTAKELANGLTAEDFSRATRQRAAGNRYAGTRACRTIFNAVDACSRALPHTNDASKTARSQGECMQHHHGIGSIFLTATFDDENSFLMQVMYGDEIDDGTPADDLTDDEVAERLKRRREIRIEYPGLSSLNFEMLLQILCEEVVGWNIRDHCATDEPGLFGFCEAFSMAIEEQGRKTLHAHMTIWIRRFRALQKAAFFGTKIEKREASKCISVYHNHVVTTNLIGNLRSFEYRTAFDHECLVEKEERTAPIVIDDQSLRYLRHRTGFARSDGLFAYCFHCTKQWTYEELAFDYVKYDSGTVNEVDTSASDPTRTQVLPKSRMKTSIVNFQRNFGCTVSDTPVTHINAVYQHHVSCHVNGCFRCAKAGKKNKAHVCGPGCECRMRLPDKARRQCTVTTLSEGKQWYKWTGEEFLQPLIDFMPKRATYDLFQNPSCKAISESKLSCNSNASLITDGPVSQYQFKYQHKSTQDEDVAEYAAVEKSIKAINGRVHEDDKKEAARLVCRAAFAHNTKNIISAPLASYLLRHESRFYFSHSFQYTPLIDVMRLLSNLAVDGVATYGASGNVFFENQALHYLCRSEELDHYSLKEFCENYHVCRVPATRKRKRTPQNPDDILPMIADTGYFKHPSVATTGINKGQCTQGVKERETMIPIKVSQWSFPDTRKFGCNIMTCPPAKITKDMERYAQIVMTLLCPHRHRGDLFLGGATSKPYTRGLQILYQRDMVDTGDRQYPAVHFINERAPVIFTEEVQTYLQNIQNCAYNSMRYKTDGDELQRCTDPMPKDDAEDHEGGGDESEEEADQDDSTNFELVMDHFSAADVADEDPLQLRRFMQQFSLKSFRDAGANGCGYNSAFKVLVEDGTDPTQSTTDFVLSDRPPVPRRGQNNGHPPNERKNFSVADIVHVLLRRIASRTTSNLFRNTDVIVMDATGSVESIGEWALGAALDPVQKRAFECIIASFILTFYDYKDGDDNEATSTQDHIQYRRTREHLLLLKLGSGDRRNAQLVCLLHGPGGSGKSTVINLVVAYAKSYCNSLDHPFTARTIVVTAMSGVAATLLHGETAHSAIFLADKKIITYEEMDAWKDARMVIIDEISFCDEKHFNRIHDKTQEVMCKFFKPFGGLNMVFAGDFSQLEPAGQTSPVYKSGFCPTFHGMLNVYIELDGMHRFRDDMPWGHLLRRFREGEPTLEDVREINSRCMASETRQPPHGTQIACYYNKNRDAINSAIFEEFCGDYGGNLTGTFHGAIAVFMGGLKMHDGTKYQYVSSNAVKRHFWEQCSEDKCKFKGNRSRVDPMLKLYAGCPLMLTQNTDVKNGQANGSRVILRSVKVRHGETPMLITLECGATIRTFTSDQIDCLTVEHECEDIRPRVFDMKTENFTFETQFTCDGQLLKNLKIRGEQFPVISNSATTGHKLQGSTALALFVAEWVFRSNWTYVVLSRVKTMLGLFLAEELSEDLENYAMSGAMKDMLHEFRTTHRLHPLSDEDYENMRLRR